MVVFECETGRGWWRLHASRRDGAQRCSRSLARRDGAVRLCRARGERGGGKEGDGVGGGGNGLWCAEESVQGLVHGGLAVMGVQLGLVARVVGKRWRWHNYE